MSTEYNDETLLDALDDPKLQEHVNNEELQEIRNKSAAAPGWYETVPPLTLSVVEFDGRKIYNYFGQGKAENGGQDERIGFRVSPTIGIIPEGRRNAGKPDFASQFYEQAVAAYRKAMKLERTDASFTAADVLKYLRDYSIRVRMGSNNFAAKIDAPKV